MFVALFDLLVLPLGKDLSVRHLLMHSGWVLGSDYFGAGWLVGWLARYKHRFYFIALVQLVEQSHI